MIIELQAEQKVSMSGPVKYLYGGLWDNTGKIKPIIEIKPAINA